MEVVALVSKGAYMAGPKRVQEDHAKLVERDEVMPRFRSTRGKA